MHGLLTWQDTFFPCNDYFGGTHVHLVQSFLLSAPSNLMERASRRARGLRQPVGWDIFHNAHRCGTAVGPVSSWEQDLPLLCSLLATLPRTATEEALFVVAVERHPTGGPSVPAHKAELKRCRAQQPPPKSHSQASDALSAKR